MKHNTRRVTVSALAAILISSAAAVPAVARQDPGGPPTSPSTLIQNPWDCALTRIGTQFVRCDDLTGAGVPAPSWVPES